MKVYGDKYDTSELCANFMRRLAAYDIATSHTIPDEFFEKLMKVAREYRDLAPAHNKEYHDPKVALMFSQLSTAIGSPPYITDPRIMPVLEELAGIGDGSSPFGWLQYRAPRVTGEKSRYAEGLGKNSIQSLERIINSEALWNGKNEVMRRVLLRDISYVICELSLDYPLETLSARLKILSNNSRYNIHAQPNSGSEINNFLAPTFTSDSEKEGLVKYIEANPHSHEAKIAKVFLQGNSEILL